MSRPWIFVSGASRGISLALTRQLLKRTSPSIPILATGRKDPEQTKSAILDGLGSGSNAAAAAKDRLHVVQMDVTDEATMEKAAAKAAELFPAQYHHLRLAFAMPGILHPEKSAKMVDAEDALMTFRVNALGPLLLMKWFGEFLPKKSVPEFLSETATETRGEEGEDGVLAMPLYAAWLSMSARVGSTTDNRQGGWYSYRASKAAVNSLTKSFDKQLATRSGDRAMAMAYHPGTVKTDLSREFWDSVGEDRMFSPDEAAAKLLDVVTGKDGPGLEGRGRCWDWKGTEVPP
jgi:NAD(P)-dependent dehydrogenase (short-subunit alcohol dehydrogenase family)